MKKWYLSKSVWVNVVMLVAAIVPASQAFLAQYFSEVGIGWSMVNLVLRAVTKQELTK